MKQHRQTQGLGIVEVIVAAAILLMLVVAVSAALKTYVTLSVQTTNQTQAALLLEEGAEALLVLRNQDWDATYGGVALGTPYSLVWNGSAYELSATPVEIDGVYRREVIFTAVSRDSDGVLDANGDVDPNTLKASVSVYRAGNSEPLATANTLIHNSYAE